VKGALLLLLAVAAITLSLPVDAALIATMLLSLLYISLWFTLCGWVISWKKNSGVNAVSLLSIWLLLTLIAPAVINNFILTKYPVPEALHTVVANREGFHSKWDKPKEHTMQKFYAHYPELKKYQLPDREFSWLWYYAMQQMGDDDAAKYSAAMKKKLMQRDEASTVIGYFLPALHTQLQLNDIAQSGLKNQLQFLDRTASFHEKKRLYFYPKIFEDAPVLKEDWSKHKVEFFSNTVTINWLQLVTPYIISILLMLALIYKNVRKPIEA
jgi:ABC-2 type transport system permease protein